MSSEAGEEYERRRADFAWRWGFDPATRLQSAIANGDYDLEGGTEEDRAFIREVLAGRGKKCCGLPMSTLDVFGVRLYRCMHRGHHALVFRNLSTGEELAESYRDGDGGLEWTSHYGEGGG